MVKVPPKKTYNSHQFFIIFTKFNDMVSIKLTTSYGKFDLEFCNHFSDVSLNSSSKFPDNTTSLLELRFRNVHFLSPSRVSCDWIRSKSYSMGSTVIPFTLAPSFASICFSNFLRFSYLVLASHARFGSMNWARTMFRSRVLTAH